MALQKPGSRREGRRLDTVLGMGRRYGGSRMSVRDGKW